MYRWSLRIVISEGARVARRTRTHKTRIYFADVRVGRKDAVSIILGLSVLILPSPTFQIAVRECAHAAWQYDLQGRGTQNWRRVIWVLGDDYLIMPGRDRIPSVWWTGDMHIPLQRRYRWSREGLRLRRVDVEALSSERNPVQRAPIDSKRIWCGRGDLNPHEPKPTRF